MLRQRRSSDIGCREFELFVAAKWNHGGGSTSHAGAQGRKYRTSPQQTSIIFDGVGKTSISANGEHVLRSMSFDGIRKDANGNGLVDQFLTTVANPFHLLSEGDAATLGKYNSHYSDDVLAHLIGEPIPGNCCFMWSAPHQPFVLPVRVRSFEGLYRGNVNHDQGAQALTNIRAQQVLEATSGALARLKNDLLQKLKAANVRYVKVPQALPGGGEGIGILSGQLFYLIKEVKQPADTQPEEHLKKPLLSLILGEGAVHLAKHPTSGKDYFCAKPEDWERVLRFPPKAEDSQPLSSEKSK